MTSYWIQNPNSEPRLWIIGYIIISGFRSKKIEAKNFQCKSFCLGRHFFFSLLLFFGAGDVGWKVGTITLLKQHNLLKAVFGNKKAIERMMAYTHISHIKWRVFGTARSTKLAKYILVYIWKQINHVFVKLPASQQTIKLRTRPHFEK